ncbi:MAG: glycerophosphoryl diester phosphodiesterase membrane domain-containing protein [Actinomycetota bacterium]|nr:glycerophosphoryl diester phosphodiesterase membrane domain-containing protein [Actinomycetota bacterium]
MVGAVVGEVWRLFLARFWRTLVIVALLLAPIELVVLLLEPDFDSLGRWAAWVALIAVVGLISFPWVIGALVHDAAESDPTPVEAYRRTAGHLPDLILSSVVTTVGIALGTLALIVPGLVLLARWALVVPLIVLEGASWREALSRSNDLVRGRTWPVLGVFVVLTLIGAVVIAVPVVLGYVVVEGVLGAWLATLAIDTVVIALYSFAPLVLYRRLATQ